MSRKTNILHKPVPAGSICRFNPVDGRAIIETSDGKVYSYDPSKRRSRRLCEESMGFHEGMWLQTAMAAASGNDIEAIDAGEYPFTKALELIQFRLRVRDALDFFLKSLDRDLSVGLRKQCAQFATRLLAEDAVRELVEPVLIGNPLPPEFDTTHGPSRGKAGEILEVMVKKWR